MNPYTTGNPWVIAATRAFVTALLLGAAAAVATWSQVDDVKQIVIAGLTPFLGTLIMRLGVEGNVDRGNADVPK